MKKTKDHFKTFQNKYLAVLLSLMIAAPAMSQVRLIVPNQSSGVSFKRLQSDSMFNMPTRCDTVFNAIERSVLRSGSTFWDSCLNVRRVFYNNSWHIDSSAASVENGSWIAKSGSSISWPGNITSDAYGNPSLDFGLWLDSLYYFRVGTGRMEIYMQPEASNDVKIGPRGDINYDSSFLWELGQGRMNSRRLTITAIDSLVFGGDVLTSTTDTSRFKAVVMDPLTGRMKVYPYAPGGGSGGGLSGLTSGRFLYATGPGSAATDAGGLYDAATNKATFDSIVSKQLGLQGMYIYPGAAGIRKIAILSPHLAGLTSGLYFNSTINYDGTYNPVLSGGINFDLGLPTWGYIRWGMEGNWTPYPGAPGNWWEWHAPEIGYSDGSSKRMYSVTGWKTHMSALHYWHGDKYDFMAAASDTLYASFGPNGAFFFAKEDADQFRMLHENGTDRIDMQIDITEGFSRLITTLPFAIQSSLHVTGNFTTSNTIGGLAVEHGGLTLTGTGQSTMYFAQGGVLNRAAIEFANHYGQISLNSSLGARGHDGANNGTVLFLDDRDGVASPIRWFVNNTSGTNVQWLDVANNGKVGFGAASSTESYLFKSHGNTSGSVGLNFTNSSNTSLFQIRNDGQVTLPTLTGSVTEMLTITAGGVIGRQAIPSGGGGSGVDTSLAWTDLVLRDHTSGTTRGINVGGAGKELYISNGLTHLSDLEVDNPVGATVGLKGSVVVFGGGQTTFSFAPNSLTNANAGIFVNSSVSGGVEYIIDGLNHAYLGLGTVQNSMTGYARLIDARGTGVAAMVRKYSKPAGGSSIVAIGSEAEDGGTSFGEVNATTSAWVTVAANTTGKASLLLKESSVDPSSWVDGMFTHKNDHIYVRLNGVTHQLDQQAPAFTLAAIGSTPNANGASYSAGTFNLQPASTSFGGVLTNGTQALAGQKTWSNLLKYNSDLSGSYDDRTLPDWGTVKALVADSLESFRDELDEVLDVAFTSTDATPQTIHTITPATAFERGFTVKISVIAKVDGSNNGYKCTKERSFLWDGTTTLTNFTIDNVVNDKYAGTLSTASMTITNSGDDIIIQWTGEAATTIKGTVRIEVVPHTGSAL
jgi:hypothetical protein